MAEATVPEAGTYAPQLVFLQQANGDLRKTPLTVEPGVLPRIDREEPQRFVIRLTPAALAAIAAARSDPPPR